MTAPHSPHGVTEPCEAGLVRYSRAPREGHVPAIIARYERLRGDAEARVTDRLVVIDRRIAFVPANKDRTLALEVRSPAPRTARYTGLGDITPRQYAIARLPVGHTDAVIADRLGHNVRTARVHIAGLATTLGSGSGSRARLGHLIAESGILNQRETDT